ncbi:hypothetical protein NUU61_008664 [Penicillium alfredii]|uniref:Altered inheritance of mitochondria protein 9, mitochondrial n=1 Tax=Penicillium alfredii TaxID=1506179 RepID=A0A9W9ELT6_9EURO|nr:uncharacterized protein NUU61_008664 [Penicillium alfredii]KAJ5084085.1 hypothetical protein NUU61_008664 [Penicillium alfredii]
MLPYILPTNDLLRPVLLHHDLHAENIFIDDADPSKVFSIIDWQALYASPLFLQARFPSVFDSDDPYPWGAVQPKRPENFDTRQVEETLDRIRLKKFYELATRKFNPLLVKVMDAMRRDDDPTTFIFYIVGQSSINGPIPLQELLVQIHEKWYYLSTQRGLSIPCPISSSREDIDRTRRQANTWADAYNEFDSLRTQLLGYDGWVSHEEYEEAKRRWEDSRTTLESLRQKLEQLLRYV